MPEEHYRLYIDESGDHVFRDERSLSQPKHRFLALVGCWFKQPSYLPAHARLEALKREHFPHSPDEPVVLHRSDIISCRGPFWRLRDASNRDAFDSDLVDWVASSDFTAVVVVVDKLKLKQSYPVSWHPYHMALDLMLERYCCVLNHFNRQGDVMAESRGGREDRLLKNAYEHVCAHGNRWHKAGFYQRALSSGKLKLKGKQANIAGLQLADVLAHPLKQQILVDNGLIPRPGGAFGNRLATVAFEKYNRNLWTGEVEGYGKVFYPR